MGLPVRDSSRQSVAPQGLWRVPAAAPHAVHTVGLRRTRNQTAASGALRYAPHTSQGVGLAQPNVLSAWLEASAPQHPSTGKPASVQSTHGIEALHTAMQGVCVCVCVEGGWMQQLAACALHAGLDQLPCRNARLSVSAVSASLPPCLVSLPAMYCPCLPLPSPYTAPVC